MPPRGCPPADQDALAELLLAQVASEAEWDRRFDATADRLAELAEEAHTEYVRGRSVPLDPDQL